VHIKAAVKASDALAQVTSTLCVRSVLQSAGNRSHAESTNDTYCMPASTCIMQMVDREVQRCSVCMYACELSNCCNFDGIQWFISCLRI
jgi:hypothetical protein